MFDLIVVVLSLVALGPVPMPINVIRCCNCAMNTALNTLISV